MNINLEGKHKGYDLDLVAMQSATRDKSSDQAGLGIVTDMVAYANKI